MSSGGGGSGGIAAIFYKSSSLHFSYTLYGGSGKKIGASGFLYLKKTKSQEEHSELILQGNNALALESPSVLVCDPKQIDYTFDEIKLLKSSTLSMVSCSQGSPMTLITKRITGDKSAWLVIKPDHDVYIGVTGVVLPTMELEFNADIKDGGTLSVPPSFVIASDTQIDLTGSLVGISDLTITKKGRLALKYPGHTGFRQTPQQGVSTIQFSSIRIKDDGSMTTSSPSKVKLVATDLLQLDFGATLGSGIPVTANKKRVDHTSGPSLNRPDCPHGYEVVKVASKTLYNPCGVGKHIYNKRNESYLVFKNVSVAISVNETIYVIINETHYNVTYYIACDYDDFILLPGQSCSLAPGNYTYNSLEIQGSARINIEPATNRNTASTLTVSKLTIYSSGSIVAKTSTFPNAIPPSSGNGGSYGGLGGSDTNNQSLYGNFSNPADYGSTGGGSSQNRGEGGGVVILKTGDLINDGLIDVSGGPGSSGSGAGSGGSVQVVTNFLKGSGTFRASGGDASSPAGGGGGGRIGITVLKAQSAFRGVYDATGGNGRNVGASGTVFIRDLRQGQFFETLIFWNKASGYPPARLPSSSSYTFDEMRLEKHGTFLSTALALKINSLVTDGTGKLTVASGSRMDVLNLPQSSRLFACDLEILVGGSLYFHIQPIFAGPSSSTVVISGILDAKEPVLGKGKGLRVSSTGVLRSNNLKILKGSSVQVDVHGAIKKSFSEMQFHLSSLRMDTNAQLTFAQGNVSLKAESIHLSQGATITSGAIMKLLNITATNMVVDNQARITCDTGGYLGGPGTAQSSGSGCGHGGEGGGSQGGASYGSVFEPQHYGSGNSGRGGGVIFLNIKEKLTLYGAVSTNGADHSSGGASGGSVLLRAGTLSGHGEIVSNGGAGLSAAGGSGGRIALYITDKSPFTGLVTTFGGCGSACGAAGTIFIREYVVGLPLNSTIVDNGNRKTQANTIVMHEKKVSYTMRLLKLVNGARLRVAQVPDKEMKIAIQNLDGDGSGSLHVQRNQTLTLGAGKAVTTRPFIFPWAMIVDEGATLNLAPVLFITRTVVSPSLYLAGKLTGGQEVNVGQDASVVIAKTGIIGTFANKPGIYSFRSLKVSSGGRIKFEVDTSAKIPVELRSVSVDVGFGGSLEGRYLKVRTPLLNVAFNGILRSDGLGNPPGVGAGGGSSSSLTGGGYGGCGGGNTVDQCTVYGSLFKATEFGSGGGTSQAQVDGYGTGGGIVDVEASVLVVDGVISSNGQGADSGKTGGGSGGSVDISVTGKLSGRGSIKAEGGDGVGSVTGAGGGGRISLLITGDDKFRGAFSARGGNSQAKSGSPGTVYIEVGKTALRTKKLYLDNTGITSTSSLPVFLKQTSVASYNFQELRLYGKVTLHLEKNMQVGKLLTDSNSAIYVKDNVVFTAEPSSRYLQPYCSFHVDTDGEIRVPDEIMFLGSNNVFKGTLTGILDMIIGENRKVSFSSSARTARYIDGQYTFITKRGEYRFSSLRIKNGALLTFDNATLKRVPLTVGRLELNFGAVLQASWLNIQASDVIIHSGAVLDLSGQGYESEKGPGAGGRDQSVGTGAGHGGYGGFNTGNLGTWYGSAFNPNGTGSGGGSSNYGAGGKGGGYLHLTVVRIVNLEGTITVDATNGYTSASGGGSGGSIWISADDILGNGKLSSSGGNAFAGGGGSGGRIGIFLQKPMSFEGVLTAEGGFGQKTGAAGTLYILDNKKLIPRKRLWIKNRKAANNKPQTVLYEADITDYLFDELLLNGMSRFEIYNLQRIFQTIRVTNFVSDGVGEIAIREKQTMLAEVLEAKESHLTLTTNIYVEKGANLVMASNLTVDGATLTLDGKLSNVRDLVVESGSAVKFGITSQTTLMENSQFVFQSDPGTQQFASVTLKSGSDFGAPLNLKLSVGKLDMKSGVTLQGKFIEIKSKTLVIGRGATLTTNNSIEAEGGDGGSGRVSSNGGSGGGHGSRGGSGYSGLVGGNPYGTLYKPDQPGRPGGDGNAGNTAGKGGGVIRIDTDALDNDGFITANGGQASSGSRAGGGSGGSVYITVESTFSGTGTVSANGGLGDGAGGCGAGGRVSIHLKSQYAYLGSLQALGGMSSSSASSGGPGTVYIQDIRFKLSYNQLHIDNQGQSWEKYITLNENKTLYHFDELHMVRKASLRILPDSNLGQISTLSIAKLYGDRSGLLHLYQSHKAVIEVVEAQLTTTKTPVNLRVDNGAEAVMATTVYIVGDGAVALQCNGTLSGIRNFYITQTRVVKLQKGSKTSRDNEPPGTFKFSNVKLFSGSSVTMEDEIEMKIIVGFLNVKFHAALEAHYLDILTSSLDVETGGLLSAAGSNKARQAVPSSEISSLPQGVGAGHASNGGAGYQGASGGSYYGSSYQPKASGRRGGSGPGGRDLGGSGGGSVKIEAGTLLINDGTITTAGGSAVGGSSAGGGSGGSLLFNTDTFIGKLSKVLKRFSVDTEFVFTLTLIQHKFVLTLLHVYHYLDSQRKQGNVGLTYFCI